MRLALAPLVALAIVTPARATPPRYGWGPPAGAETLAHRFPPPSGYTRVPLLPDDFGAWLRTLPLAPAGTPVRLFDGRLKARQDLHAAVVAIDVGQRDLQQCADAVMRLWAEYLLSMGSPVEFRPDPRGPPLAYDPLEPGATRATFARYLTRLFAEAGSASLQAELAFQRNSPAPGDVLIQGGYPGHAVLVLDAADDAAGHRRILLGQSYMPAQSIHVLVNPGSPDSPWYDAAKLYDRGGLRTAEWPRPFKPGDLRRFRY